MDAESYGLEMPQEPLTMGEELRRRILANLKQFDRREHNHEELTRAAVALIITSDPHEDPSFVITRRSAKLKNHAGQWALPGGRLDPGEGVTQAALRETEEEIGVELDETQILGLLDDYPTRSGFVITPVVLWAGPDITMRPNPDEVAAAYVVPLRELDAPDVPRLKAIPESDRLVISVPIASLDTNINAPTAAILYQFREVGLRGLDTRVDQYDQAVFAWR